MKQITKVFGILSSILILAGVIFKALHWPGAAIILLLGVVAFAAIYAILLFVERQKEAKTAIAKTSNVFVLFAMVLISVGFLFKSMHWPGAGVLIYVSNFALLALIPIKYIQAYKNDNEQKKQNYYNEAIVITLLLAFSLFLMFVL